MYDHCLVLHIDRPQQIGRVFGQEHHQHIARQLVRRFFRTRDCRGHPRPWAYWEAKVCAQGIDEGTQGQSQAQPRSQPLQALRGLLSRYQSNLSETQILVPLWDVKKVVLGYFARREGLWLILQMQAQCHRYASLHLASPLIKNVPRTICMLAYEMACDLTDEYLRMSETTW
jgi:hypothetical protein